jgi:arginyl-tRNA synthetase
MHARITLCSAFRQVVENALHLLTITPLERM